MIVSVPATSDKAPPLPVVALLDAKMVEPLIVPVVLVPDM